MKSEELLKGTLFVSTGRRRRDLYKDRRERGGGGQLKAPSLVNADCEKRDGRESCSQTHEGGCHPIQGESRHKALSEPKLASAELALQPTESSEITRLFL